MEHHAVIVLTLNNTQETVTFEEIREFELLSDETQEPLPDESESGSCNIRFVISLRNRFFVIIEKDYSQHKPATFTAGYANLKKKPNLIQCT